MYCPPAGGPRNVAPFAPLGYGGMVGHLDGGYLIIFLVDFDLFSRCLSPITDNKPGKNRLLTRNFFCNFNDFLRYFKPY